MIVELFADAGMVPNIEPQDLDWKYWRPYREWEGSRSFLLATGNNPIAHCGVMPRWCSWGTSRVAMIQPIDWVARPGSGGAGIALMKQVRRRTQALLSIGGSAHTLSIVPHMGFKPLDHVTGYALPLHPLRRVSGSVVGLLPRLARSYAWKLTAPAARAPGWRVRPIIASELARIAHVFPVARTGMALLERSVELFRYVLSCPIVPFTLFAVERAGQIEGYFLLATAPGQVRIADCWMSSEEPAAWRALILCAIAQAKQDPQAAEVVAWANDRLLTAALGACGFHARFRVPVQILPANEAAMPPVPLRVQLLDSDAAYLNPRERVFWA